MHLVACVLDSVLAVVPITLRLALGGIFKVALPALSYVGMMLGQALQGAVSAGQSLADHTASLYVHSHG